MRNYRKVILLVFLVFGFFMRLHTLDAITIENNNPSCEFVYYSTDTIRNDNTIITPIAFLKQNIAIFSNYNKPILPSYNFNKIKIDTVNSLIRIIDVVPPSFYIIDFLQLDSKLWSSIDLRPKDILKIKSDVTGSKAIIKTKLLIVVDDMFLDTQEKKKEILSTFDYKHIASIEKFDKEKAIEIFGKKGKNGALQIKTK